MSERDMFITKRNNTIDKIYKANANQFPQRLHKKIDINNHVSKRGADLNFYALSEQEYKAIRKFQIQSLQSPAQGTSSDKPLKSILRQQPLQSVFINPGDIPGVDFKHRLFIGDNGELIAILQEKKTNQRKNTTTKTELQLGKGGAGVIYIGININTGEQVAIKRPRKLDDDNNELPLDNDTIAEAYHEKNMMEKLDCLVSFIDTTNGKGQREILIVDKLDFGANYLAISQHFDMKIKDQNNKTLESIPKLIYKMDMAIQFIEALENIHGLNYLHRDVKLENIMWDEVTRKAKIIDFGLAADITQLKNNAQVKGLGSPVYKSTDVYQGLYSKKSDIYACGVGLLELFLNEYATVIYDNDEDQRGNSIKSLFDIPPFWKTWEELRDQMEDLNRRLESSLIKKDDYNTQFEKIKVDLLTLLNTVLSKEVFHENKKNVKAISDPIAPIREFLTKIITNMIKPGSSSRYGTLKYYIDKMKKIKEELEFEEFKKTFTPEIPCIIKTEYKTNKKIMLYIIANSANTTGSNNSEPNLLSSTTVSPILFGGPESNSPPKSMPPTPAIPSSKSLKNVPPSPAGHTAKSPRNVPPSPTGHTAKSQKNVPPSPTGQSSKSPKNVPPSPTGQSSKSPKNVPPSPTGQSSKSPNNMPSSSKNPSPISSSEKNDGDVSSKKPPASMKKGDNNNNNIDDNSWINKNKNRNTKRY